MFTLSVSAARRSVRCSNWKLILSIVSTAFILFPLMASNALGAVVSGNQTSTGELMLSGEGGIHYSALLLASEIEGEVNGLVATMTLKQHFRNDSAQWVNGKYVFPLPEQAAVDSLSLENEGRVIHGVVKEKEQAKREFEAAKASGKKAGLLQQSRPNLFSMALANIAPHSEVIATITWVETVAFDNGRFSLRLPTTLTPRFIPANSLPDQTALFNGDKAGSESGEIEISSNSGWSQTVAVTNDAAEISPPFISQSESLTSNLFSLSLSLNSGIALAQVISPSHGIDVLQNNDNGVARQQIQLTNNMEPMDSDLILEWLPVATELPDAAVFAQQNGEEHHTLLMLIPPMKNLISTLPREIIFIIDSSGSMSGVSMPQAKAGLKTGLDNLAAMDRFNIIDFDSDARSLFPVPVEANQGNLHSARGFVDRLVADGGTQMEEALAMAFAQPVAEGYLRQVVFITDGSVGNESALFKMIHSNLGDARLFTVGIGSAPNSHFMRAAAEYGRGSTHFIGALDQAAARMSELFNKINRPLMRDIKITWPTNISPEFFPARIPDLYMGEPLMVVSKSDQPITEVIVSGTLVGKPWQRTVRVDGSANSENLDKVWARRKIKHLESLQVVRGMSAELVRQKIVALGVNHQLMTRFTSFIAVEQERSRPVDKIAQDKAVANLVPKGNTMVLVPNTATPATLLMIIGGLMLLLAFGLWRSRALVGQRYA